LELTFFDFPEASSANYVALTPYATSKNPFFKEEEKNERREKKGSEALMLSNEGRGYIRKNVKKNRKYKMGEVSSSSSPFHHRHQSLPT
jgi:hypothetical protein